MLILTYIPNTILIQLNIVLIKFTLVNQIETLKTRNKELISRDKVK